MNSPRNILVKVLSIEVLVLFYFFALLVFGKEFTKFKVAGPLYLHDLVLGILTLLSINNRRKIVLRFTPVLILIGLSVLYLLFSILFTQPRGELLLITLRQFNLIIYLVCAYFIFNILIKKSEDLDRAIHLIKWIAYASILLQVIFIIYGYIFIKGFDLFSQGEYHYFSPLVIFGVIAYGGHALAYERQAWKRYSKFGFCILLSTTLGHSSAFFALFVLLLLYAFIRITPLQRLIAVVILLLSVLPLFFLPQFTDANASWRLLFWEHVLQRLITTKYLFFGFGFGQPYMTAQYASFLNEVLNSPIMMDSYGEYVRHLTPPHNSLLTIAFHLGIVPLFLLFIPLKGYFSQIFFKRVSPDASTNFLIYVLTGCFIWIAFNVILELPHSATFFWLVYFAAALYINKYHHPIDRTGQINIKDRYVKE